MMQPVKEAGRLATIRHIALDMDGTIYKDSVLFPFTKKFLSECEELGIGYTFITNNNSRSVKGYLKIFQDLGLEVLTENIYTSTMATLKYLRKEYPAAKQVFILGTDGMQQEFKDEGFTVVTERPHQEPDLVIVGFDTTLTFERLSLGAFWINQGKPFIATHPDAVCPTDEPKVLIDCGSICAALEKATGVLPEAVLGKPNPMMLEGILERHELQAHELVVVGDRLYTDIALSQGCDVMGVLVLTGEATEEALKVSKFQPDLVVPSIWELGILLRQSRESVNETPI